jgi:hypothetical protein
MRGGRPTLAVLERPGALLTPLGLGARVQEVEGVECFARIATPERLAEHLARGADLCESSAGQRRRALLAMAEHDVIPAIQAAEGTRPPPSQGDASVALDELAVPTLSGRLGGSRGLVGDFLRRLGAPRGFLVEDDGVRRVSTRRRARRMIEFDGMPLPLTCTRISHVRHRRQIEAALAASVNVSQAIAELAQKLPEDRDTSARVLHAGPAFTVTLEEQDSVRIARRLEAWEICHEGTRRYFPAAEIRVSVGLDVRACPWVSGVTTRPALNHMFVRSSRTCIAGYAGHASIVGRRALELLERAESVLKLPTNADGAGGYQMLESSGSPTPRKARTSRPPRFLEEF